MQPVLIFGIIVCVGFFFGGLATKLNLPKVTGYIVAGIILNPGLFHFIPEDFISQTTPITNIALAIITFSVGGTLLYSRIKKLGRNILYITVCEAEFAFLIVALGSLAVTPFFIRSANATWLTFFVPISLLLASLAAPTDPSATLAVVHLYKAKGIVTSTTMGVAAFDDVLGIINYSIATVIAQALILNGSFSPHSFLLQPAIIISGALLLGIVFGLIFNSLSVFVKVGAEGVLIVLILGLLSLCFGLARSLGVDALLATMVMGIIVVNFNKHRDQIFKILERYTEQLVFLLFFTLSGIYLNLSIFASSFILVLLFFIFRTIGKVAGTMAGAFFSKASPQVRRYTAGGLIPQGGLVVGLALMMKQNPSFSAISDFIISIIIGSTIIHEFIGPILVKISLKRAGEIKQKYA